jgi:hypothetical protein
MGTLARLERLVALAELAHVADVYPAEEVQKLRDAHELLRLAYEDIHAVQRTEDLERVRELAASAQWRMELAADLTERR